jgi:Flp pilus assembly pilin Flp
VRHASANQGAATAMGKGRRTTMHVPTRAMLTSRLALLAAREDGQILVEYSLVILIVALATIAALTNIGGTISGFFANVVDDFG